MANTENKAVKAVDIWNRIKDAQLDIFALPNQTIKDHVKREEGMDSAFPNDVYLILRSAAVYPALEESLGKVKLGKDEKFEISQSAKYTIVKIIPKNL